MIWLALFLNSVLITWIARCGFLHLLEEVAGGDEENDLTEGHGAGHRTQHAGVLLRAAGQSRQAANVVAEL